MVVILDISSPHCCTMVALVSALKHAGVHAQVTETMSTVPYRELLGDSEELDIEAGFRIQLFNIKASDFRYKVWGPIRRLMPLECGHVQTPEYMGCLSNWPGVMVESRCNETGARKRHSFGVINVPEVTLQSEQTRQSLPEAPALPPGETAAPK
jgi:hypothetical protein